LSADLEPRIAALEFLLTEVLTAYLRDLPADQRERAFRRLYGHRVAYTYGMSPDDPGVAALIEEATFAAGDHIDRIIDKVLEWPPRLVRSAAADAQAVRAFGSGAALPSPHFTHWPRAQSNGRWASV
jgi:hypothetical protein